MAIKILQIESEKFLLYTCGRRMEVKNLNGQNAKETNAE
jgi:hypothetical protein